MKKAKVPVTIRSEDYEIEFDALITQDETLSASITEYAVEEGYSVSDSIVLSADTLSMTLFLTNTPVTWLSRHGASTSRVATAVELLKELFYSKSDVEIITTDSTFTSMGIESITISKSVEIGTSREIPISFKKINITKSEVTTIPESYGKSGASLSNAGTASSSSGISAVDEEYNKILSFDTSIPSTTSPTTKNNNGSILYNAASGLGII